MSTGSQDEDSDGRGNSPGTRSVYSGAPRGGRNRPRETWKKPQGLARGRVRGPVTKEREPWSGVAEESAMAWRGRLGRPRCFLAKVNDPFSSRIPVLGLSLPFSLHCFKESMKLCWKLFLVSSACLERAQSQPEGGGTQALSGLMRHPTFTVCRAEAGWLTLRSAGSSWHLLSLEDGVSAEAPACRRGGSWGHGPHPSSVHRRGGFVKTFPGVVPFLSDCTTR